MAKKVTVIPAKVNLQTEGSTALQPKKRRVVGYARVSTDTDEQGNSMDAQLDYYPAYIKQHGDWEFCGMFSDEGKTGCNTKNRAGFNKMVAEAVKGNFDLIITKSVSRFARNTVDNLSTIRKLKAKGCEVYFEKENIWTFDSKGELLITIMSSLAQEESRSISENVTWGQRKRMSDGRVSLPYKSFLGYEKGEDGLPKIVDKEARIVRKIYKMYLSGKCVNEIAKILIDRRIPSPRGSKKWSTSTVRSILTNEKYKGDALLQKAYTVDFLTKKKRKNNGEIQQWYVENSHPAIILPEEWDMVQAEFLRRTEQGYFAKYPLSRRLQCKNCGGWFGRKVWDSTGKYKKYIWQCNDKYKDKKNVCRTPHITESQVYPAFIEEFNKLIVNKKQIIEDCNLAIETICDTTELSAKIEELQTEIEVITQLAKNAIQNSGYSGKSGKKTELIRKFEDKTAELKRLQQEKDEREHKSIVLKGFVANLSKQKHIITEFDEVLWNMTVDRVFVNLDGGLEFIWKK